MQCIVMFPHSPKEYQVPGKCCQSERGVCGWNRNEHRRRFLLCGGDYIDVTGALKSDSLLFWSEWEANTLVTQLVPVEGETLATWLHEPRYPKSCPTSGTGSAVCRQNTDPCVFGASFKYALCRQQRKENPTLMQKLDPGSLILFGGTIGQTFYLDTVFVVGERAPYVGPDRKEPKMVRCSDAYRILTVNQTRGKLAFYRGVIWAQREDVSGLYSFTPGKILPSGTTVKDMPAASRNRCALDLGALNQIISSVSSKRFSYVSKRNFTAVESAPNNIIHAVWNSVLSQVRGQGFVPCVHFPWPEASVETSNEKGES